MALTRTQKVILREIRALQARRVPLNISAVKRSHPKLMERVYAVRPYWGWKRALEDAGLSYAKINTELRDYVDCKICGRDLGVLTYHLISQHQITPEEYRQEYPEAELVCETVRAGIAWRKQRYRPPLPHWEHIWTAEYVLERMAELYRRKFPLNFDWAKEHDSALSDKAIRYFGSWDNALGRVSLDPRRIRLFRPTWRGFSPWRKANKAVIVAELRRRERAGEPLSWKKILPEKSGSALLERARKVFGTWSSALEAAGIDPWHGRISPWGHATRADILAEIGRRRRARKSVRYSEVWREKGGQPLVRRGSELFGSWNSVLRAVGIEPERGRSRWADASKRDIVAELRRRKRARESLRSSHVAKQKRGRALQNRVTILFGTWNAALRAAGIEPVKENSPWRKANKAAILKEIRRRERAGESLQTTKVEREKWGTPFMNRCRILFGSWTAALLAAGVDPPAGVTSPWQKANKAAILTEIRSRKRAGKTLRISKIETEQWGSPLAQRARILFGSWNATLLAAGFEMEPPATVPSPWSTANKTMILAEIRRRRRAGQSVRYTDIQREKWGKPLLRRATNLFGSWSDALRAVGIEPVKANSPWPKTDKAAILDEIHRRSRAGQTLASTHVAQERFGKPLIARGAALFGSWTAALFAAGLRGDDLPQRRRWSQADKAIVLDEIRRRKRGGESLRTSEVERGGGRPLLDRARTLFGSWGAALLVAGV